jgi:hypothetical protein
MISFMISVVPGSTDRQDQPSQSVTLSVEPRQGGGGWEIVSAAGGVSIGPGLSISDKRLSMENLFERVAPRDDVLSGELTEGKTAGRGTGVAGLMALVTGQRTRQREVSAQWYPGNRRQPASGAPTAASTPVKGSGQWRLYAVENP